MTTVAPIGVRAMIVKLLSSNETVERGDRLTDPQVTSALVGHFEDRPYFHNVSNLRCLYNSGRLTNGKRPRRKSKRYDVDGSRMAPHKRYPAKEKS